MKIVIKLPRQVTLSGQLDSKGAGLIYHELVEFSRSSPANVSVDMANVEGCTRAGCGIIFVAAKLLQQNGARLQVRNACAAVLETISARGFHHLLVLEACPEDHDNQLEQFRLHLSPELQEGIILKGHPS